MYYKEDEIPIYKCGKFIGNIERSVLWEKLVQWIITNSNINNSLTKYLLSDSLYFSNLGTINKKLDFPIIIKLLLEHLHELISIQIYVDHVIRLNLKPKSYWDIKRRAEYASDDESIHIFEELIKKF